MKKIINSTTYGVFGTDLEEVKKEWEDDDYRFTNKETIRLTKTFRALGWEV